MTNFKFQELKTPPSFKGGAIVIQSDDGKKGDYTHWFKLFKRKDKEYNSWGKNAVPFSPAVNTGSINSQGGMTVKELHNIKRSGGEIASHGRFHMGFLPHEVEDEISIDDDVFRIKSAGKIRVNALPATYTLYDGEKSEEIIVTGREHVSSNDSGNIYLSEGVKNSYSSGAEIRATEETMASEWQGAIDDLNGWGIECRNHAWPWNDVDEHMKNHAQRFFKSARGSGRPPENWPGQTDLFEVEGLNITGMSITQLSDLVEDVSRNNTVGWVYGHAETDNITLEKLEHLVDECLNRGVEIITHDKAIDYLS